MSFLNKFKITSFSLVAGLALLTALVTGCPGDSTPNESETAILLDIDASGLTQEEQTSIATVSVQITGGEAPVEESLEASFEEGIMEYDYKPTQTEGSLKFRVVARDEFFNEIASAETDATIQENEAVEASVTLVASASATGCKIAGAETQITNGGGSTTFDFVFDDGQYLMVYADAASGNSDIMSVRLAADGQRVGEPVVVESTTKPSFIPSLVKTDSGYFVAWQEGAVEGEAKSIHARKLDEAGKPVGSVISINSNASEARPVLANTQNGVVMAWMDDNGAPIVQVAQLNAALDGIASQKAIGGGSKPSAFPWLAAEGSKLGLLWSDATSGIYRPHFGFLDNALNLTSDTELFASTEDALLGRLISTGSKFFAAWEDKSPGVEEIHAASINADGSKGIDGNVHPSSSESGNWPHMAWDGTRTAVVYYQFRDGPPQVYLALLDENMVPRGDAEIQISSGGGSAKYPDIKFTGSSSAGSNYGVTWYDDRSGTAQLYFKNVVCK